MRERRKMKFYECLISVGKTMRLIAKMDIRNLLSYMGNRLLRVIQPFAALYFTARLVNVLVGGEDIRKALGLAALLIVSQLILQLLERFTDAVITVEGYQLYWLLFIEMGKTMMRVDYKEVEDPELKRRMDRIIKQENIYWCGPWEVPGVLMNLIEGVTSTALAVGMSYPVFFGEGRGDFLLGRGMICLCIAVSVAYMVRSEKKLYDSKEKDIDPLIEINGKKEFYHRYVTPEQGAKDIRLFEQEGLILDQCRKVSDAWKEKIRNRNRIQAQTFGIRGGLSWMFVCCAYAVVGLMAIAGYFTVGNIVQYVGALSRLSEGIRMFIYSVIHIRIQGYHCQEYLDFIGKQRKKNGGEIPIENRKNGDYEFEFRNVSFRYPHGEKNVLDHVSFRIGPGQKVAVVGVNGSGKSTMIKLLCRLYEPTEGEILLNGINILEYCYEDYISLLSAVFQDFTLFALAVGENIAASSKVDAERVWGLLEETGAADRIRRMPEGLEQPLYGLDQYGINISGGEAQKIAIARALYKDSRLVIMDEPTSALDPIAEYEIYDQFNHMVKGRSAIYISHRLSSCRFCDKILVFHEGGLVQEGTHEELVENRQGQYFQLWNTQAQYYQNTSYYGAQRT